MESRTQYIPLQEAAKYCNYSQEYLSLRARQGKLRAIKIGRNWVTKKEWIEEYLSTLDKRKVEKITEPKITEPKIIEPPENLPVETSTVRLSIEQPIPRIRFGFITLLIFVSLVSGVFFYWKAQPQTSFEDTTVTMVSKEVQASAADTLREYSQWFKSQIPKVKTAYFAADNFVKIKLTQGYYIVTRPFVKIYQFVVSPSEEAEIKEELEPEPLEVEEGIVVVPSTEEDEEIKKKIKESFSDEVRVEPKDKTSGIIIPIFREGEGQKYLYIMVPTEN